MKIKTFYHVITGHGNEVTEEKPAVPYVASFQLTPGEGKVLALRGERFPGTVETDTLDGWEEIDA